MSGSTPYVDEIIFFTLSTEETTFIGAGFFSSSIASCNVQTDAWQGQRKTEHGVENTRTLGALRSFFNVILFSLKSCYCCVRFPVRILNCESLCSLDL